MLRYDLVRVFFLCAVKFPPLFEERYCLLRLGISQQNLPILHAAVKSRLMIQIIQYVGVYIYLIVAIFQSMKLVCMNI